MQASQPVQVYDRVIHGLEAQSVRLSHLADLLRAAARYYRFSSDLADVGLDVAVTDSADRVASCEMYLAKVEAQASQVQTRLRLLRHVRSTQAIGVLAPQRHASRSRRPSPTR